MPQNPSFKWMPARPTAPELAQGAAASKAASRPCLPVVEQLGDRVMLSADVEVIANPDATVKVAIDQILIGLIKGELQEAATELSLLKTVAEADPKLGHKFTAGLLKVDDILYKMTEYLIKGDLTELKILKAVDDIKGEFIKIDTLVGGLPELDKIKFVLDDMESKATTLLGSLSKIEVVNELTDKERQTFLKITDAFGDLDAGLLKIQEDLVSGKYATGEHLKKVILSIRVPSKHVVASLELTDGELKEQLLGTLKQYQDIVNRLILPPVEEDVIILD